MNNNRVKNSLIITIIMFKINLIKLKRKDNCGKINMFVIKNWQNNFLTIKLLINIFQTNKFSKKPKEKGQNKKQTKS